MSPSWRRRPAPVRIPAPAAYSQTEHRERRRSPLPHGARTILRAPEEAIRGPCVAWDLVVASQSAWAGRLRDMDTCETALNGHVRSEPAILYFGTPVVLLSTMLSCSSGGT